ncbi:hypothetical protein MTBBW1_2310023 [Desulfamplus magnetovallimortis]|uniref:Uncharacterized protein n=1 Tax=Desulfamplus magnetovallimortis TaxID=1246637 RepID=A0A1W1HDX7_9BACT|nr:hypothetical protein [Desulfamplus magnetovallimortis]SLM30575.1 hypothetical protein MTBBW1_2310023 [Desulfamplus magnetovallimortis]
MQTITEHMQATELPPDLQKRFRVKPQQFLKITIEVQNSPPYDVPKQYPEDERQLVREAMAEAEKEKQEEFDREETIKEFFALQDEISEHLKKQEYNEI